MLPEIKQKLDNLVSAKRWSEMLVEHNQEGVSSIGIYEVYGNDDGEHVGVSWTEDPLLVADDLPELKKYVGRLTELINAGQVIKETDLEKYNMDNANKLR